ncbi:LmeA family phospholipid-binding protein [Streptomyces sp. NPDC054901]
MKRRWVKVLVIVVVILAGLFVAADRIAVHYAEKEAVALAEEQYGYGAGSTDGFTEISIHGFPFLTQAADLSLDHVSLSAGNFSVSTITNAQGDHLNVRKLDLDLHDLTASSLTGRSASANLVTGRLTIGYEDLSGVVSRLLADGGALTVAPDTGVGGGGSQEAALRITGTWNGRPLDTAASVAIAADEFELRVPELGGSRYTWRVPLPQNINFTAARSTQNGLELEATGHQVVLGR